MAKFSKTQSTARPKGPISSTTPARTHEGGQGFTGDVKSELFRLSVTNMVGETSFYESAKTRDDRFVQLVHEATKEDPAWTADLIGWLRSGALMRSASVVAACEYVKAGGPNGRAVIASACQRPDEPGEVLGYWLSRYGRNLPMPVKRGLADAAIRLYSERSTLRYDTASRDIRFADVIELAHPKPRSDWQSYLFRHLIDRRHDRPRPGSDELGTNGLLTLARAYELDALPVEHRREALRHEGPSALSAAGYSWERLAGWLPGGMDAEAWEAIIPSMGLFALIRNLRNFEQAGVSDKVLDLVEAKLKDPDEVTRARVFPYHLWSAYVNSGTMRFAYPLERALEASVSNIPQLTGRSLVMVDTSASMTDPVSSKSKVQRCEVAALFAAALASRGSEVRLWPYADGTYQATVHVSVLRTIQDIKDQIGQVGHGTKTWPSTHKAIQQSGPYDRVFVFSDVQDHEHGWFSGGGSAPAGLPVYVWDLAGYKVTNIDTSKPGQYLFAGFTDACFRMVPLLEKGNRADWPWA